MMSMDDALKQCSQAVFQFPQSYRLEQGMYGGLVLAVALHRIESVAEEPVRSIHINFSALARAHVETRFELNRMRQGSKTASYAYAFFQGAHCVAHGSAFTGHARKTMDNGRFMEMPTMPEVERVPAMPSDVPLPPYTKHFVLQPCLGDLILSGRAPRTGGYISFADQSIQELRTAHIGAMIDAWWPSFLITSPTFRPMGTTSLHVNLHPEALPRPNEPCLLSITGEFLSGGFGSELNQIWSKDGKILATAQQCIAVIA